MPNNNEKRKHIRAKTHVRVNCKSEGIFFSDFTRDISFDGAGIESLVTITPGTIIDLFFTLPEETETIMARGKVLWSRVKPSTYESGKSNAMFGVQFIDINDSHKEKLFGFVSKRIT